MLGHQRFMGGKRKDIGLQRLVKVYVSLFSLLTPYMNSQHSVGGPEKEKGQNCYKIIIM